MAGIVYVVFDTNALYDSCGLAQQTYRKVFSVLKEKYDFKYPTSYKSLCGRALDASLSRIIDREKYPDAFHLAHETYRRLHDTQENLSTISLFGGVDDALGNLKKDEKKLYAITEEAAPVAERLLVGLGIRSAFDAVQGTEISGEVVGRIENFMRLVDQEEDKGKWIMPPNAIFVGASTRGIRALSSLHYRTVGATWGLPPEKRQAAGKALVASGASVIVSAVEQLAATIHHEEWWRPWRDEEKGPSFHTKRSPKYTP